MSDHYLMDNFDSTITCGYYDAFQLKDIDHTYALIQKGNETWAFPCYGQVARFEGDFGNKHVKYPVDLWTPYMLWSRNVGSSLPANLFVALGMAQFRTNPTPNFRLSDWVNYWKTMPDGVACWAGIVYAVAGVCQQVCNRVLWCTRERDFLYCPVNWPPSFSVTYWIYGYWGKITEGVAELLARRLVDLAHAVPPVALAEAPPVAGATLEPMPIVGGAASAATGEGLEGDLRTALGKELHAQLCEEPDKDRRQDEIQQIVSRAAGGAAVAASPVDMSGLLQPDEKFSAMKSELDKQLLRGEVSHREYADRVNRGFSRMLEEFRNVLPPETFEALFPEGATENIVRCEQMPESYEVFQRAAAI